MPLPPPLLLPSLLSLLQGHWGDLADPQPQQSPAGAAPAKSRQQQLQRQTVPPSSEDL